MTTDHYLIVANLAPVQQTLGVKPYQVWIQTNGSSKFIYDYAKKNGIEYTVFEDVASKLVDVKNDALFQGTNGILTMSFIIILILCSTGFLIYWILSIRQRELLFGVFRAMGMTKKEIIQMLINEQIFSSGISILIGAGLGVFVIHSVCATGADFLCINRPDGTACVVFKALVMFVSLASPAL